MSGLAGVTSNTKCHEEKREKKKKVYKSVTYLSSSLLDSASSVGRDSSLAKVECEDDVEEDRVTPCGRKRQCKKMGMFLTRILLGILV